MNIRRFVYLALLILHLWFFFWGIPIAVLDNNIVINTILGGILFFILSFQFCGDFRSISELTTRPDPNVPEAEGKKMAPFMVVPSLIILFLIPFCHFNRRDNILKEKGITVNAVPTAIETTKTTRRFRTTTSKKLIVQFYDTNKILHATKIDADNINFDLLEEGDSIKIVYWPEEPTIAESYGDLYSSTKNRKRVEYDKNKKGIASNGNSGQVQEEYIIERDLQLSDILNILDSVKSEEELLKNLNKINTGWTSKDSILKNRERGIEIKFVRKGQILMTEDMRKAGSPSNLIWMNLTKSGFEKLDKEGSIEIYQKDEYKVMLEKHFEKTTNGSMKMYFVYFFVKG